MKDQSYRQVSVGGALVGLTGLDEVFEEALSREQTAGPALGPRLLREVEKHNYIPPNARQQYEEALAREYERFRRRQRREVSPSSPRAARRTWRGRPREEVPWYPTLEPDRCDGCGDCVRFCALDVYDVEESSGAVVVQAPFNCIVACDACAKVCRRGAIRFPPREMLARLGR